jgi:hypothetical protein
LVVNGTVELDTALVFESKGFLEMGEHACSTRNGEGHAAEFAKKLVPLFRGNTAAAAKEIEQFFDAVEAVGRKLNGAANGIN